MSDAATDEAVTDGLIPAAPQNGEEKIDAGARWYACCGAWWSTDAWKTPARTSSDQTPHRIVAAGAEANCDECGRSLRRHQIDRVEAASVLASSSDADLAALLKERLRETEEGDWLRFGPQVLAAGASVRLHAMVYEPRLVTHMALPSWVTSQVRILSLQIGRETVLEGPLPGEIFAVRIPTDARHPIDRGGTIGRPRMTYPAMPPFVVVENMSSGPVEVLGAFLGREPRQEVGSGGVPGVA